MTDTGTRLLLVRLGAQVFGLPLAAVVEVLRLPGRPVRVPHAPPFLAGLVNLRGQPLPVIDAAEVLSRRAPDTRAPHAVVLRAGPARAGLVVEALPRVVEAAPGPDAAPGGAGPVAGWAAVPGRDGRVPLLEVAALLRPQGPAALAAVLAAGASPEGAAAP